MKSFKIEGTDEKIYVEKTEEGLPIYMWPNLNKKNFYMTLNVRYGAIHTEFKLKGEKKFIKVPNGIAHFMEHLMFYMPDGKTAHEYFNNLGSIINACTTHDFTYYEVFGGTNFKENLDYLLDYVYTPYFTKENIKAERDIINEEISMYNDNPDFRLITTAHKCLWHKNKRKNLVSGTKEDIKKITIQDLKIVYENFYHPENMFLVITGNFNPSEAVAIVKQNLAIKEFPKYTHPQIKDEKEPNKVVNKYYEENDPIKNAKLKVVFKVVKSNFKEYLDDEIKLYTNFILKSNFGITSTLHENLFNNNIILNPLDYSVSIYENHLTLMVGAVTNYPDEVIKYINNTFANLEVEIKKLNNYKKTLLSSFILTFDEIEPVNSLIQDNLIAQGVELKDLLKIIKSLNTEDLNKILKKLTLQHQSIVVFKPQK